MYNACWPPCIESSQLFDHQKFGFSEMLEGQVDTKRLLTEIIDKIDKVGSIAVC